MEENAKKITLWKIIKWTVMAISLIVYLAIFLRIFVSCDADISDDIILTTAEKEVFDDLETDYPLYNYQPSSWTNEDGTLQIKNVYYLQPISELQLTVRYRISTYDKETDKPFEFKIRTADGESKLEESETALYAEDLPGEVADNLELHTESRFDYKYIRICAPDIVIDEGERFTERVQIVDEDGNVTYDTETRVEGGNKVYLDVYDSETKELLYSFVLAGKTVNGVRTKRTKCEVRVID